MSRLVSSTASVLLFICGFLPSHPAHAAIPNPQVCWAGDAASLSNCVDEVKSGAAYQIVITSMIECTDGACDIDLNSANVPSTTTAIEIAGDPSQSPNAVGLHRTGGFDSNNNLIDIENLSNVTITGFTIYDDPASQGPITVDGTVVLASGAVEYPVFCGTPAADSTVSNPKLQGVNISASDTGITNCPVPGYVTVKVPDSATPGGYDYPDVNTACFHRSVPSHYCPSDDINISGDNGVTISNMVLNHAQGDSVDVGGGTDGFYFLNNTVENAYFRGLSVTANDISIEGNTFFANRAAGLHVYGVTSTSGKRPSDISANIFDHNQHGDAFPCGGHEGCSGGQIAIAGSDFVFYGNIFLNGYMDFYDPTVLEETDGPDAFNGCNLSWQCSYAGTDADQLWANGGGVDSGHYMQGETSGGVHRNPDVEFDKTVSGIAVFSHNYFDYGSTAFTYDPKATTSQLQLYDNELFDNHEGNFFNASGTTLNVLEEGDCYSAGCGDTNDTGLTFIGEGPTTAAAEDSDCHALNGLNCLWMKLTNIWSPAQNSLALGSNGTDIQCALKIYGPGGGTLLATVQGSGATCTSDEGVFIIPASVAQHQTSVQIAYEILGTGQVSAKLLVPLPGMVPTITGTGAPTCSGSPCVWMNVTDAAAGRGNCAVGIYDPTTLALITTLTGSSVTCASTQATFIVPTSVRSYSSIVVNYQNLVQGTWSKLATVTLSTGTGGGGGGGTGGCGTGTTCQQQ